MNMHRTSETYKVLAPTGSTEPAKVQAAPLGDLNGKRIIELWDYLFGGDAMLEIINAELRSRFPSVDIVEYTEVGNIHGVDELDVVETIPGILSDKECDGAIVLVAA